MQLVDNVKNAGRWFSMQVYGLILALPVVWVNLPDDIKAMMPQGWGPYVFMVLAIVGGIGRLIKQDTAK